MENNKVLTENEISIEAGNRYKDNEGGYDLWAVEAFEIGAKIAVDLKNQGKGILPTNDIKDGYEWAVSQMFK